jgi:hypothetical protein
MKLVFIHGRDQQGKDPHELRTTWINTLKAGLEKSGLTLPDDAELVFPFYGDLLDGLVKDGNLPATVDGVLARGETAPEDVAFFHELLNEVADNASVTEEEVIQNYEGNLQERGPLNWKWVQAILQTLDDKTGFGNFSIKKFTYDVYLYLTMPGVKRRINEFVTRALDDTPCVVVAHSLGTVVGYNVLSDHPHAVKKYITLGSPLGLKSIKSRLKTPLAMPSCVSDGWYNAYDDRDVVALNPLNKNFFNITPEIVNKNDVKNHTDNRHGIEGYLDDKEVARTIYEALK